MIKRVELDIPDDVRRKLAEDSNVPEKLRLIKKVEIFFAAKYKDPIVDEHGRVTRGSSIENIHVQDSILFSYLPTTILEYKFPVLINTNFLTNTNREQIHIGKILMN
ncbi:unnamed protein product [Rotaria sp. Silwood2]|nr:unnamed protein product [Rotaria sp. Silwood2]